MNLMNLSALVVDFETTGFDPQKERAVEVAAVLVSGRKIEKFESLISPGIPIPPEASAIHHLIADDLTEAPTWAEVKPKLLAMEFDVIVAHNAQFDMGFMSHDGGAPEGKPVICTWRMAKKLLPDMPSYSNMALHYRLGLPGRPTGAHRAMSDALVTAGIYKYLLGLASAKAKEPGTVPLGQFLEWLNSPIMEKTIKFGKHQGRAWAEIAKSDPSYLRWVLEKSDVVQKSPDIRFTIETLLKGA